MRLAGYSYSPSRFAYPGDSCPQCAHKASAHFWWLSTQASDDIIGCRDCLDNKCQNRKEVQKVSAVNLCERCDSLMLGKAVGTIDVRKSDDTPNEHVELCPACIGDLVSFLAEKPTRDRETFRQPWKPEPKMPESRLMLEHGPCGVTEGDFMCLRAKGHEGSHVDGTYTWNKA